MAYIYMNIFPDSKIIFNTLLFLFLIHPPLILAELEDTERENKTAWPYATQEAEILLSKRQVWGTRGITGLPPPPPSQFFKML